jgi:hypothetical protein
MEKSGIKREVLIVGKSTFGFFVAMEIAPRLEVGNLAEFCLGAFAQPIRRRRNPAGGAWHFTDGENETLDWYKRAQRDIMPVVCRGAAVRIYTDAYWDRSVKEEVDKLFVALGSAVIAEEWRRADAELCLYHEMDRAVTTWFTQAIVDGIMDKLWPRESVVTQLLHTSAVCEHIDRDALRRQINRLMDIAASAVSIPCAEHIDSGVLLRYITWAVRALSTLLTEQPKSFLAKMVSPDADYVKHGTVDACLLPTLLDPATFDMLSL